MKKKKAIVKCCRDIDRAIEKLHYKRDWFTYVYPNEEKEEQIRQALIELHLAKKKIAGMRGH